MMLPGAANISYISERIEKTLQKYSKKEILKSSNTTVTNGGVVTLGKINAPGATRNGGL
jgi:hypothetical protein